MHQTTSNNPPEMHRIPVAEYPSLIVLAGPPGLDLAPVMHLLERAGLSTSSGNQHPQLIHAQQGAYAAEQALKDNAKAHLLLFYISPNIQIAEEMSNGQPPDEALSAWKHSAEAILAACRPNRRRTSLFDLTIAFTHPEKLIQALNRRLNMSLSTNVTENADSQLDWDPVSILIAQGALRQDTEAYQMATELEATAIPLATGREFEPGPREAYEAYQQHKQELKSNQPNLQEENDLLLMQLHRVQEELENYYRENQRLRKELDSKKRQIEYVYRSKSWRITAPLRAVLKLFKRKG